LCIAKSENQAEQIVAELQSEGFSDGDISVLFPDKQGSRDFAHEKGTKMPEGAATGAATGGAIGGTLGLLARHRRARDPRPRSVHRRRSDHGGAQRRRRRRDRRGVTGALVGLGIPEYEAKQYESKVKGGNILISVHTDDGDERTHVKEVFTRYQADDIATAGEKRAS
jgi:hypothetical protein